MTVRPARSRSGARQRGAALLTAMIIVTLVATLAVAMVWQQWRAVQVETAERGRAQAAWILSGALEFAKLILSETVRATGPISLNDNWATPLAEARLSTFLAVDKNNVDDGPEAFLSGDITDAQGRYNLRNLVDTATAGVAPKVVPDELAALTRLCSVLGIEGGVAQRIASGLLNAITHSTGASALMPRTVAQLTWLGIDSATVQALAPYVVLLPEATALNVNTASKEVLAAVTATSSAAALVQQRQAAPFTDIEAFKKLAGMAPDNQAKVAFRSAYFEVRARLRLNDQVLIERSLVQWQRRPTPPVVLRRERIASLEQVGG
ncbi:MAG TPA: type II secretion system minor pseudopilin GspK [Burkholderiaceae bacterium]|nr:type II secretion system minor pseudopilin GspK [Burkholderiaceae bacterium]